MDARMVKIAPLIDQILAPGALRVSFQPVYEAATLQPHYVECLIRGPLGTTVEQASVLFDYVRRKDREADVDRACVTAIFKAARRLSEDTRIGLNVHASTLAGDPEFLNFFGDAAALGGIEPTRLVVEIVEHAPSYDVGAFLEGLAGLRDIGARVALDDIGLGHSNYRMILDSRPDYFKIDRYFVKGCHDDYYRQAVLASVAQLARPFGALVVAEGIESHADLEAVKVAGIGLAQGFLFGRACSAEAVSGPRPFALRAS
jgi:EAL domain-containing protein (putative c-di-GMP-specific phosphodiesterase class I)